jgi:CHASE3 domain sensor protein
MSESSPSPVLQTLHSPWLYVAMAIVTVMAAYSYLDGQAFRNAANSAERSRSLVAQNQELLTLLMDTGANQTGYLLTGDSRYLDAYNLALSKVSVARQVLRRPDVASPEDCANLDSLIAARLEDLAQTIRIRQQGDVASALQRTDRGKDATDQIRALGAHIIAHEDIRFREHTAAALRQDNQTRIVVQLGALILFGLLWFSTWRIDRLMRAQNQIVSDLELTRQREARGSAALATTLRGMEESESRYRLLFEANPQPMWVFDRASLAFLAVNHAAVTRYGYTREEFLGMTLRDIRPPEDVPLAAPPEGWLHPDRRNCLPPHPVRRCHRHPGDGQRHHRAQTPGGGTPAIPKAGGGGTTGRRHRT